jgi:rhodanese-related sulfurtransferase
MSKLVLFVAGAVVIVVLAAGMFSRNRDQPDNLTLASPSGAQLAADGNTLLVDIRTPQEWAQTGVVEGALLVTYADADSFLAAVTPHLKEGQTLSLICRSGNRTSRASRQIAAKTDRQIVDVAGGMQRVVSEGYTPVPAAQAAR